MLTLAFGFINHHQDQVKTTRLQLLNRIICYYFGKAGYQHHLWYQVGQADVANEGDPSRQLESTKWLQVLKIGKNMSHKLQQMVGPKVNNMVGYIDITYEMLV